MLVAVLARHASLYELKYNRKLFILTSELVQFNEQFIFTLCFEQRPILAAASVSFFLDFATHSRQRWRPRRRVPRIIFARLDDQWWRILKCFAHHANVSCVASLWQFSIGHQRLARGSMYFVWWFGVAEDTNLVPTSNAEIVVSLRNSTQLISFLHAN